MNALRSVGRKKEEHRAAAQRKQGQAKQEESKAKAELVEKAEQDHAGAPLTLQEIAAKLDQAEFELETQRGRAGGPIRVTLRVYRSLHLIEKDSNISLYGSLERERYRPFLDGVLSDTNLSCYLGIRLSECELEWRLALCPG